MTKPLSFRRAHTAAPPQPDIAARVAALDWSSLAAALGAHGCATTGPLLRPQECTDLATLAPFVLVGFASTPSILSGGIDVSVGPLATFINCLFIAVLLPSGLGDWYAAIPLLLVTAAGIGAVTGVLVAVVRLHPVVASTGVLFVLIGLSITISKSPVSATPNWSDPLAQAFGWFPGAIVTIGVRRDRMALPQAHGIRCEPARNGGE